MRTFTTGKKDAQSASAKRRAKRECRAARKARVQSGAQSASAERRAKRECRVKNAERRTMRKARVQNEERRATRKARVQNAERRAARKARVQNAERRVQSKWCKWQSFATRGIFLAFSLEKVDFDQRSKDGRGKTEAHGKHTHPSLSYVPQNRHNFT